MAIEIEMKLERGGGRGEKYKDGERERIASERARE